MLKRLILTAVIAAAVALTGSSVRADYVVDTFTTPAPATSYTLGSSVGSNFTATDSLGGGITRTLSVTLLENLNNSSGPAGGEIGDNGTLSAYSLSTKSRATAYASLTYSYAAPQNFSVGGSTLRFSFLDADLNVPFSAIITDSSSGTATVTGIATAGPGVYVLPMSSFGSVDLTNVSSITLVLNQNTLAPVPSASAVQSADLTLTDVRVTTPEPPSVPAPPAAILLLAAAPALGLARLVRRRKTELAA